MSLAYTPEESYAAVWDQFRGRCVHCFAPANHLHEIEPRSKRPSDWWEKSNRVPLCHAYHTHVHSVGTRKMTDELHMMRRRALLILS